MPHWIFTRRRSPAAFIFTLLIGALAGAQADPIAAAGGAGNHELPLRSASAQTVIETLHWTKPENLPEGVTSVAASATGKALVVTGTDAGFASVQEIVLLVDIPVKSVRLRVQFVSAKTWDVTSSGVPLTLLGSSSAKPSTIMSGADTRIQQASGAAVAKLQTALTKSGGALAESTVTAPSNAEATVSVGPAPALPPLAGASVAVTPRVNDDHSVTLFLRPIVTTRGGAGGQKEEARETKLVGKVAGGEPVMIGNLARAGGRVGDQELLIFITPTILNDAP